MHRYTVTVTRTLTLTTSVAVRARHEDKAQDQVRTLIKEGKFGIITWDITECQARIDGWEEESDEIEMTSVEEE